MVFYRKTIIMHDLTATRSYSNTVKGRTMEDERLARARGLIRARRYSQARALLASMDNETARRWLAKLDERERTHPARSEGLLAALIVAGIVLLLGGGFALGRVIGLF